MTKTTTTTFTLSISQKLAYRFLAFVILSIAVYLALQVTGVLGNAAGLPYGGRVNLMICEGLNSQAMDRCNLEKAGITQTQTQPLDNCYWNNDQKICIVTAMPAISSSSAQSQTPIQTSSSISTASQVSKPATSSATSSATVVPIVKDGSNCR